MNYYLFLVFLSVLELTSVFKILAVDTLNAAVMNHDLKLNLQTLVNSFQ